MKILITEKQFKRLLILLEDFKSQREKYINQGYNANIVDRYLNDFKEIKEKKYREAAEVEITNLNVPKGNARFDIDQYKTFQELEILVDYVTGQRNVGSANFEDIEVDGTPIFENDDVEIYYADTPRACIQYKGDKPYSWCVSRKEGNMFYTYRLKPKQPAFYFVKRKKATSDEFKLWDKKEFNGTFKDKYHFFVIQVIKYTNVHDEITKQYVVTSADNDGDDEMNWKDILKFAPELKGLNNIFQPKPLSYEEEEKIEKYQNGLSDEEFIKLPYKEKKHYLDIYVTMEKLLTFKQFESLPDDLKNHYIGFGVPLSNEQFELIENKKTLITRYKQIAEMLFVNYLKSDKEIENFYFTESRFKMIDIFPDDIYDFYRNLTLTHTSIKTLNNLTEVRGSLNLENSKINFLGKLRIVMGDLNLNNTPIQSLGNLVEVGGKLSLMKTSVKSLGNLEYVKNNLNLQNSQIKTLSKLRFVGGSLYLGDSEIESLGNLQTIVGSLYLKNTSIKSLGDLDYVGGSLFLENSKIETLGQVRNVMDYIYVANSFLSKNYSKEELENLYPNFKDKFIFRKSKR